MVSARHQTMRQKRLAIKRWFLSTTFRAGLMMMVMVFGVLYVMQTSSLSTKGYEISDLEQQIEVLEQDNQKLEFQIATHRSMDSIQTRLASMNLVSSDNVEYVTLLGTAVALR